MKLPHLQLFVLALLLSVGMPICGFAEPQSNERARAPKNASQDTGWIRLFDGKSLKGWSVRVEGQKENEDPAKLFQVHDGEIHVYRDQAEGGAVAKGFLASESEYAYYHLRLEYKWGTKRFRPRAAQRRDTGLLYHVVAPDKVWPRCIECQIQESDVGDCFTVRGTQVTTNVEVVSVETPNGSKKLPRYKPAKAGGARQTIGDPHNARIVKSSTHERDGWNTVEVIVRGSEGAVHIVNGHEVFQANDLRQLRPDDKGSDPLSHGRIALQAEFAEVFYRNIEIRPLREGPLQPVAGTGLPSEKSVTN